jgi:GTP-binding protein EngB required for normal cell division
MRNVNLHEKPDVEVKVLATKLDHFEKSREEGHADDASNQMSFDSVANEQLQSLLVESMSLLDHKGLVQ